MLRTDIIQFIVNFMNNSNVDEDSIIWKNAKEALLSIALNKIED